MDTSNEYIKMCEEAKELQSTKQLLWGFMKLESGDWFWREHPEHQVFLYMKQDGVDQPRIQGTVWLPHQDQLQDILKLNSVGLFQNLKLFCEVYFITQSEIPSFEQIWLMIVMGKKYNKTWNKEKQTWIPV